MEPKPFIEHLREHGMSEDAITSALLELREIVLAEVGAELMERLSPPIVGEIEALPPAERAERSIAAIIETVPQAERAAVEERVLAKITGEYLAFIKSSSN